MRVRPSPPVVVVGQQATLALPHSPPTVKGKAKSDTSSLRITGLRNQWGLTFSQRRAVTTEERSKEASADAGGFTVAAGVGLLDGA